VQIGDWSAALEAYGALVTAFDQDDWAYHQGAAYSWVRLNAPVLATADVPTVNKLLNALPQSTEAITGVSSLDALYSSAVSSLLKGAKTTLPRGVLLGAILQSAVRLELAHRLSTHGSAAAKAAAAALFAAGSEQYVQLLTGYFNSKGSKACCFGDLKLFLVPLLESLPGRLDQFSIEKLRPAATLADSLAAFADPKPVILALPYVPTVNAQSSSDAATEGQLLRFTFTVATDKQKGFLDALRTATTSSKPTSALAKEVETIVLVAREAAVARRSAEKGKASKSESAATKVAAVEDEMDVSIIAGGGSKKKDKKKDKKETTKISEEAKSERRAVAPEEAVGTDPHRVEEALKPQLELSLTPEQEETLHAARSKIRNYTSALQLLRYLGRLGIRRAGSIVFQPGAPGLLSADAARAAVADIVQSWTFTLPLSFTTVGGEREVQEGDDLTLIATQMLWELGFAALADETTASSIGDFAPGDLPLANTLAARQYFVESAILLELASELSPYNALLRIAALRAYAWLGANASIINHAGNAQLRLKHIQRDTLSHAFIPHYTRLTWLEALRSSVDEVCSFHRSCARENTEFVRLALNEHHYSRALDIMRLRLRLKESGTFAATRSLNAHMGLSLSARNYAEAQSYLRKVLVTGELADGVIEPSLETLTRLRDNDDREVFPCWDPPSVPLLHELRFGFAWPALPSKAVDAVDFVARSADSAAAFVAAALGDASPATVQYKLTALAGQFATGSNGGTFERFLRRVLRDANLVYRSTAMKALQTASEGSHELSATHVKSLSGLVNTFVAGASAGASTVEAEVRKRLLSDFAVGCLPIVDSGVTNERSHIRSQCAQLLLRTLEASSAAADDAPVWSSVTSLLTESSGLLTQLVTSIRALRFLPIPGAAVETTGKSTDKERSSAPLNASALAEATLLSQHTAPFLVIAAAQIAKAIGAAKKAIDVRSKGKAKAPLGGGPEDDSLAAAADASAHFLSTLTTDMKAMEADLKVLANSLEVSVDKATPVFIGGFTAEQCASDFVRHWVQKSREKEDSKKKSEKSKEPVLSGAAEYLHEANTSRDARLKARIDNAVVHIGASYTNSVEKIRAELDHRVAFLKDAR
jgi:hypothetical protein